MGTGQKPRFFCNLFVVEGSLSKIVSELVHPGIMIQIPLRFPSIFESLFTMKTFRLEDVLGILAVIWLCRGTRTSQRSALREFQGMKRS